jgi:hypothetical protein
VFDAQGFAKTNVRSLLEDINPPRGLVVTMNLIEKY